MCNMCIASMYHVYCCAFQNSRWNQFFHVWHRMQTGPRRPSLASVVVHGSAQEWTLLVRNFASSFTTLSWNLSKSCKLKFPLSFSCNFYCIWCFWPHCGHFQLQREFSQLLHIMNYLIWLAIAYHTHCHSTFQYRSWGIEVMGGQSEDSLYLEVITYTLQIVLRVKLQIAVSIFRSHTSPISSWPFVLRYWNHLSPQKLAYETSRMVGLHTSWITHIKMFW